MSDPSERGGKENWSRVFQDKMWLHSCQHRGFIMAPIREDGTCYYCMEQSGWSGRTEEKKEVEG